jgi:Flp pilus assembly protein TadD
MRALLRIDGAFNRFVLLLLALSVPVPPARSQEVPQPGAQIDGVVRDSTGKPVAAASVQLQEEHGSKIAETKTNADGSFVFSDLRAGAYALRIQKPGFRDETVDSLKLSPAEKKHCEFVLKAAKDSPPTTESPSPKAIELDDRPNFTVAGITDSTGSGGHGSETRIRTGEVLAKETRGLESRESNAGPVGSGYDAHAPESVLRATLLQNPRAFEANRDLGELYFHAHKCREAIPLLQMAYEVNPADHPNAFELALAFNACAEFERARGQVNRMLANEKELASGDEADLHRLLGDLDEKLEDPLAAVHEYERAARLEASEQNYFAWGTELLLHKAAQPAAEVFREGVRLHPDSARMLAGLGAALYTSGSAEEGARRLCEASDLEPATSAPYLFLGKMQEATSTPLPCAEQTLARFAQNQPANASANYYYALALWRRGRGSENSDTLRQVQTLLEKASTLDPRFDPAYLELGNLYLARGSSQDALAAYQKAGAANTANSQVHYRLGLTYKRMGDEANAKREFEEYERLEKTEADTIERQRRELRQFVFVLREKNTDAKDQPHSKSDPVPPTPK